jgi:uncharacterized protein (DUF885 family)
MQSGPVGNIGGALFPLLIGDFAPFSKRMISMVQRMEQIPEYLRKSKDTWIKPVNIWTKFACDECDSTPGLIKFINQTVNQNSDCSDDLKQRMSKACDEAINAIKSYKFFLENDILPKAKHNWCIGEDKFRKLLEIRKLPFSAEEILNLGWNYFNEIENDLKRLANEIAPEKQFDEIRLMLKKNHPENFEAVFSEVKKAITKAKQFVQENDLASFPNHVELVDVKETPEFLAPLVPIATIIPPAYFDDIKKSTYLITRHNDSNLLQEFSYNDILNTSVHEAYPGHHHQQLMTGIYNSYVHSFTNGTEVIEGWAHYCEQMMYEEGYLQGKEFEFIQKLGELWRAARIIIDVELAMGKMTIKEAVTFLVDKVGRTQGSAEAEVNFFTTAPGFFLSYLTGKHLLLELRNKMKKKLGEKFSLKFFHDIILKNGSIPYHFLERIMEHESDKLLELITEI